jgi:hypothetical protein
MSAWHDGRLCAFDIETTGVDYETDRIVTAAVALVGGGLVTEQANFLLDPGVEIPESATQASGRRDSGHPRSARGRASCGVADRGDERPVRSDDA